MRTDFDGNRFGYLRSPQRVLGRLIGLTPAPRIDERCDD